MQVKQAATNRADAAYLYDKLQERILARDQIGASETYYDLLRAGRPVREIMAEGIRIHAPYTHVPYHERIDDGFVNFVNNDHCLLSARAGLHLARMMPDRLAALPMAQTIWYIPTGLDIWNQKIGRAPGHYTRAYKTQPGNPVAPQVFWQDQTPERLDGPLRDRLNHWMTLVHRGQVIDAYRVFLGLMEDTANRREVLAELVFAGMIDLQDRVLHNRSYTTGHKSYRARATVEIGHALGWENAHDVIYAGALDIAVGPRWYSTYEMASNAVMQYIEGIELHAVPYSGTTPREREVLTQTASLSDIEQDELVSILTDEPESAYIEAISKLLLAGKGPRQILDAIQVAAARILTRTQIQTNFSVPQHCYEYCNTLAWFYDNFEHPQRLKLLYVAASFVNRNAHHQRHTGDGEPVTICAPGGADRLSSNQLLDRIDGAITGLDGPEGSAWIRAYLDSGADRVTLVDRLGLVATRLGNDPHNQEIAQCLLEDYRKNPAGHDRDHLLFACAQHTATHRKYGDTMEAARRFGEAMGVAVQ